MAQDAYIDDQLVDSIEAIQEIFGISTFRKASKKYDELARKSKVGEIINRNQKQQRQEQDPHSGRPGAVLDQAEEQFAAMEDEMEGQFL